MRLLAEAVDVRHATASGNTALMLDRQQRLWLFWPTIIANTWESCLTNYKVSSDYQTDGPPKWDREAVMYLKPADFGEAFLRRAHVRPWGA